jgi:ketosteroid isomerase-like protein
MESTDSTARDTGDLTMLRELNQAYLDSVRLGDVERFRQLLADDFQASTPAGEILDKSQFLERTAGPRTLDRLEGQDVRIRILGDVAIIHAATSYTSVTGQDGRGRYTDDWQKRNGRWVCVSAHVTRLS